MTDQNRRQFNEQFYRRLVARRPQVQAHNEKLLAQPESAGPADLPVGMNGASDPRAAVFETIVRRERPVLFVRDGQFDTDQVTMFGPEAEDLVGRMKGTGSNLLPMLPLIGRIDVTNFPGDFVGTGWFVDTDIVVTNRHVASLIARWDGRRFVFARGVGGRPVEPSLCNAHEFDDLAPDAARVFKVVDVLYIESDSSPNDIAFIRVERRTDGRGPAFIRVATADAAADTPVCVIGYPARASKRVIPDQALMNDLYRGHYDVKRAAPGYVSGRDGESTTHDCTTLGGNSGSVVLDLETGTAVGLHYAGLYQQSNFAVRASVLSEYVRRKRWNRPTEIETRRPAAPSSGTPVAATIHLPTPLRITITVEAPQGGSQPDLDRVEAAVLSFWDARPEGVLAVRVGYLDQDDRIGEVPCIAASVRPKEWARFESTGPREHRGVHVRYLPADVEEQVQSLPSVESVDEIKYDDDARTDDRFSFDPVHEAMDVTLHVGPEYSWDVLKKFLAEADGRLVSAMYEFHGAHIRKAIEERLDRGASLTMVLDNATFSGNDKPKAEEFDRVAVFEKWARDFKIDRVVAPEGVRGLISDSYHIKVTVRQDDQFWLSSGNWKMGSSQPVITQAERDHATEEDLRGNREWHVVIRSKTLASRFREHILQDSKRSKELGGGPVPRSRVDETLVDIPIDEGIELERRPPRRILEPLNLSRKVKVKPLLTPDREGAVYSQAVLGLIESAKKSLLFQIPYIAMPPNPRSDRGYIDELIRTLTRKLKSLDDARVILRSGGKKFSAPTHAAWYFKSKGVDIDRRLRIMENHHTKGMIVDGERVLLGSHNWSKPGVSLNRDASLIFDDVEVAGYYAEAFEIDWDRANRIKPRRFVESEFVVREAVGDAPPQGFQRVRLADLAKDE